MSRHACGERVDIKRDGAGMRSMPEHDREESEKCQHASGQRIEEKLYGRLASLFVAPDADQKEEGHERKFKKT